MHVTVAIPTKNEAGIGVTLQQLAKQTRPPDLVLVGDDSDDGTAEMARSVGRALPLDVKVFDAPGGVGAAREALRKRTPDGLLVCLDAQIDVPEDWIEEHVAIHETASKPVVVSGPWAGQGVDDTLVEPAPSHPAYFVEANCSMHTDAAERLGGWDPGFRRGCDWDFRIRLANDWRVVAVVSERVQASQHDENAGGWLHVRSKLGRPSSIPYLRKYGPSYLNFHPLHVAGDVLGLSALAAFVAAPLYPAAVGWGLAAIAIYGWQNDPPGYTTRDRLVASLGVFSLGWSTLKAATREVARAA